MTHGMVSFTVPDALMFSDVSGVLHLRGIEMSDSSQN